MCYNMAGCHPFDCLFFLIACAGGDGSAGYAVTVYDNHGIDGGGSLGGGVWLLGVDGIRPAPPPQAFIDPMSRALATLRHGDKLLVARKGGAGLGGGGGSATFHSGYHLVYELCVPGQEGQPRLQSAARAIARDNQRAGGTGEGGLGGVVDSGGAAGAGGHGGCSRNRGDGGGGGLGQGRGHGRRRGGSSGRTALEDPAADRRAAPLPASASFSAAGSASAAAACEAARVARELAAEVAGEPQQYRQAAPQTADTLDGLLGTPPRQGLYYM